MNILIIDQMGAALDIALRYIAHGHKVRVFIRHTKDGARSRVGDGLIERIAHWEPSMKWADLIFVTDNTYYIAGLDRYHKQGYPIFGPTMAATELELNRKKGDEIFKKAGIATIPSTQFTKYDEALAFVKKTMKRYVSKPDDDDDKSMSYVSKGPADLVYMIEHWKKANKIKSSFILQEFTAGTEMAVGGWFGPGGFNKQLCENWEFKKLMNDDLGVATGEQGTILRYVSESKLADKVLLPLEGILHGLGYVGYIDVNCIIDDKGNPWPLEFTMRPGWPCFQIQTSLHKGDDAEWMLDLVDGHDSLKTSNKVACGVVLSVPDYPYSRLTKKEVTGIPIYGVDMEDALTDFHLSEAMWGKAPIEENGKIKEKEMFVSAGDYILTVCGSGSTIDEARTKAYKNVKKVSMPNSMMYRTDIGCRLEEQLPKIQEHGFAEGLVFCE